MKVFLPLVMIKMKNAFLPMIFNDSKPKLLMTNPMPHVVMYLDSSPGPRYR